MKYKILNKDSYKIYDELSQQIIDGGGIDSIITDPPYDVSQDNNFGTMGRRGIDFGKWDYNFDLYSWIDDYSKLLNKNGSMIIFCSYRYISNICDKLEENNIAVKDIIIWQKSNPMPRNRDRRYVQDMEFAIWGAKKGAKWIFNRPQDKPYLRSMYQYPIVSGKERTKHPTQKSLELMKEIIKVHTNENDIILDPFMGSGTTGIASVELNRRFIGIEKETEYFNIAKERFDSIN